MAADNWTSFSSNPITASPLSSLSCSSFRFFPLPASHCCATPSVTLITGTLAPAKVPSNCSRTSGCLAWEFGPLTRIKPRAPLSRASIALYRKLA